MRIYCVTVGVIVAFVVEVVTVVLVWTGGAIIVVLAVVGSRVLPEVVVSEGM